MSKFYLTTAIAYVNAPPHVGHALEFVQADALARYHRLKGDDTYFLTGTDEHGVKVYETAKKAGIPVQDFAEKNAKIYESLPEILNLSNDDFIKTSSERHKAGVKKLWKKMFNNGDIYKGVYKGKYCVGCEAFIPDKDLDEEGHCPIHKTEPKILEEENYFFRLSEYSDRIKKAVENDKLKIIPLSRKNEMLNIIGEEGLHDVSFSRPKEILPWGIEVPDDESQVMYVWCDALSNYITAVGYESEGEKFKKYWPCDVHVIGKDILRFHAGIWIGMLMSAELALPRSIYVHGFVTSEGHKMSKSLGNVIDPLEYVKKYGLDPVRYFLLREIPTTDDGDFNHERFVEVYNSELANGLGNLLNRVVMMTERYVGGKVPELSEGKGILNELEELVGKYMVGFEKFDIKNACEIIIDIVDLGNKYIDEKKPWIMAKEDDEELSEVLYNLLELLRFVVILLLPILPETADKVAEQIGIKVEGLSFGDLKWGGLKKGTLIEKGEALFPRLEE
ncbi:methionine--tRNA ligase [Candidatus Peregrinibacteria bacterium]|nr:methionine--tRNA ligase [Candidatus Peregrinibacteria bacterium]